jgi:hypothetical protein
MVDVSDTARRCIPENRFASIQRRQNEYAVCGHVDGDCYDINSLIANHCEGIRIPVISAKGFKRLRIGGKALSRAEYVAFEAICSYFNKQPVQCLLLQRQY